MKLLSAVLIACTLTASVAVHAETVTRTPADSQQLAQANVPPATSYESQRPATKTDRHADECVGPVSFCNLYFGS
ncbi:MAG TPA: hypothetical protein VMJ11_06470 [Paraburkholderia sp.]|uniref:hypothetical protein n=1 Tax=Paraburkholderia sp. TaxID=1926495 RepID=UPI002B67EB97|nr:hypothetical protein [Paraburkholderia sp.]HTR06292.1 hypothetical protein [Paraburkholderia sp.]